MFSTRRRCAVGMHRPQLRTAESQLRSPEPFAHHMSMHPVTVI